MATNGETETHAGTYDRFLWLMKWGSILTAIVTVAVVALIAS